MELLQQIKLLTSNKNDALINLLIDRTKAELKIETGKEYNAAWDNVISDIVVIKINRLGNEGIQNTSVNGLSDTYKDNYPSYIQRQINYIKTGNSGNVRFY